MSINANGVSTTKTAQLERAALMGREGFHSGKKAPAQDARVLEMLKGRKVGQTPEGEASSIAILDAWNSGWFGEYLKATA